MISEHGRQIDALLHRKTVAQPPPLTVGVDDDYVPRSMGRSGQVEPARDLGRADHSDRRGHNIPRPGLGQPDIRSRLKVIPGQVRDPYHLVGAGAAGRDAGDRWRR